MDFNLNNKSVRIMLFATDCQPFAELAAHIKSLNFEKFDLIEVTSLKEAIYVYRNMHPDLIIASFSKNFEEIRGLGLYVRERDGHRHTGFMVLCTQPKHEESLAVRAFEAGADDFLNKSISEKEFKARIAAVVRLKMMTDQLRKANHRLEILSMTDDLTSLANMRAFNQSYSLSFERVRRKETGLFVVMFDLDNFKSVNDSHNHLVGSNLIKNVALRLKSLPISKGVFARYGGDEYILYSESMNPSDGKVIAEQVREVICSEPFMVQDASFKITASVGSAYVKPGYDGGSDDAIKLADLGLYESKRAGKNHVHSWVLGSLADFDHICRAHSIHRDPSRNDDEITTTDNPHFLQKTG